MSDTCTKDLISNAIEGACSYVQDKCDYAYLNFYAMHYCAFNGYLALSLPVLILVSKNFYFIH